MLSPRCERCSCTLRADTGTAFQRIAPTLHETAVPIHRRTDTTAVFACLVSLPFLLPLFGLHISDIAFAVPLVMLVFATARCAQASTRSPSPGMWRALAAACGFAAAASLLALLSAIAGGTLTAAFYLGTLGSVGILAAGALVAFRALRGARRVPAARATRRRPLPGGAGAAAAARGRVLPRHGARHLARRREAPPLAAALLRHLLRPGALRRVRAAGLSAARQPPRRDARA